MAPLIGVDGCPGGWVGATLVDGTITWRTAAIGAIDGMVLDAAIAAIDIPIGLTDSGWRSCDQAARAALGSGRSRVFMTPPRPVVELGLTVPNDVVQARSRELTGQGVSRQALGLATRILDVDRLLPDERIVEVHPELSFRTMTGAVLASKKTSTGVHARVAALHRWHPGIAALVADCPAPIDDALDALAALWTATRIREGTAIAVPPDAPRDPRGVPMVIWA